MYVVLFLKKGQKNVFINVLLINSGFSDDLYLGTGQNSLKIT